MNPDHDAIAAAVGSQRRTPENRARDVHRHPAETLAFFGVRPETRVLELFPLGGWYTEILAVIVGEKGSLRVVNPTPGDATPLNRGAQAFAERVRSEPERFAEIDLAHVELAEPISLGPPESVDLVLTFRNTHNWVWFGLEEAMYRAAYDVLRPGGVLGVEQHRAPAAADARRSAQTGYVPEPFVVDLATRVGFRLEASSEINANPRDTKDHPGGVWSLPPSFALGAVDREKYAAIGESDRMTLRFRKPTTARHPGSSPAVAAAPSPTSHPPSGSRTDTDGASRPNPKAGTGKYVVTGTVTRSTIVAPGKDGIGTLYLRLGRGCPPREVVGVAVVPHADLSARDGKVSFRIENVPAGEWSLIGYLDESARVPTASGDPSTVAPKGGDLVFRKGFGPGCIPIAVKDRDVGGVEVQLNFTLPAFMSVDL